MYCLGFKVTLTTNINRAYDGFSSQKEEVKGGVKDQYLEPYYLCNLYVVGHMFVNGLCHCHSL